MSSERIGKIMFGRKWQGESLFPLLLAMKSVCINARTVNMFLKRLSFGSKECTNELKLEFASFLGQKPA